MIEEKNKELEGTPCKFCQFAVYENNTQIDCKFGLLDQYKQLDIKIIEAYDSDKEFYLIQDKVCMYYRSSEMFKNHTKEQIQKQNQFKFDCFIYIDEEEALDKVKITVDSLLKQTLLPSRIIFIFRAKGIIKPSQLRELGQSFPIGIKWKTEIVINTDLTIYECIDSFCQNLNKEVSHYCILKPGTRLSAGSLREFNDSILERLESLLLIYKDEFEYIVSKHTHRMLGGNYNNSLVAKLLSIGDDKKCRKLNCL